MKDIRQEVNALIEEMNSLKTVDDDLFIQFFEKEKDLQKRLGSQAEAAGLSPEEKKACSEQLAEAFAGLQGKMSFCTLS